MGKRGPPPKPTALKRLQGNPGRRPLNSREPAPPAAVAKCPAWLPEIGKRKWRELMPKLAKVGLFRSIDPDALANYCQLWARWRAAEAMIREEGVILTSEDKDGNLKKMRHPATLEAARLISELHRYQRDFGMTPASRPGIDAGDAPLADEGDDFDAFLKAKHG